MIGIDICLEVVDAVQVNTRELFTCENKIFAPYVYRSPLEPYGKSRVAMTVNLSDMIPGATSSK